ncbi:Putative ribonuclease H protein At1g65750 [Linum perenne]
MTNSERKRRHLTENSICPRCNLFDETVSHILRECHYAIDVWNNLGLHEFCSTQNNLCSWLSEGMKHQKSLIFGIGCWYLWKARNEWVFSANLQPHVGLAARISSNATAGGLIRDHLGHCFSAFSANLGRCSITRAELRGILHGLEFSWSYGYKKVRLHTDSQSAVLLILAEDPHYINMLAK